MTRLEIGCGSRVPAQRRVLACYEIFAAACAAIFRKQSRHTQSSPSTGIGKRAVSPAHQHGPAGLQVNAGWPYIPSPIYAQDSPKERREKS
jgi:hypothetical protein